MLRGDGDDAGARYVTRPGERYLLRRGGKDAETHDLARGNVSDDPAVQHPGPPCRPTRRGEAARPDVQEHDGLPLPDDVVFRGDPGGNSPTRCHLGPEAARGVDQNAAVGCQGVLYEGYVLPCHGVIILRRGAEYTGAHHARAKDIPRTPAARWEKAYRRAGGRNQMRRNSGDTGCPRVYLGPASSSATHTPSQRPQHVSAAPRARVRDISGVCLAVAV
jgi:hypothetical protein